jgi:tripartite-type tricarboxylate transporter receptor subunit TctC
MNLVQSRKVLVSVLLVGAAMLGVSLPSIAQTPFPSKPIKVIVPTLGGTNDLVARLVAPKLSEALGQPVIVDTKAGAGGNIGTDFVAKSDPDGYTLLIGYNGPIANNVSLEKLPFSPVKDLAPITLAVTAPQLLVVSQSVPVSKLSEFIAYSQGRPGQLSYGSVGPGSGSNLAMEWFKVAAGVDLVHIPYKGAAPAVTDLLAGTVQAGFFVPGNVLQYVKAGRLKVLASAGRARSSSIPEAPTLIESGFRGFEALAWVGWMARAGTPKPIIDLYNREIVRILHLPEVHDRLRAVEFDVVASTPQEFEEFIRADIARWSDAIKKTGITSN